jgi:hypothetical protein
MDLTQVVLGAALLAVSSLTFAGPPLLESSGAVYALVAAALVLGTGAWLASVARDSKLS